MQIEKEQHGAIRLIRLAGRLDAATSDSVQSVMVEQLDDEGALAVDLSELEYVSSAGLRVLLLAQKKLTAAKQKMAVFGLKEYIHEIFEIAGFTAILTIVESEEAALSKLAS